MNFFANHNKYIFLILTFFISILSVQAKEPIFDINAKPIEGDWYKPKPNVTWYWQLQKEVNPNYSVEIYDIDLFDSTKTFINTLQRQGKKVICYFSAGSYEDWRIDKNSFPKEALGKPLHGWEGERWLDIRNEKLASIMQARLDLAVLKSCDGVEPDNMDAYINNSGFKLSAKDQLAYNKFIANEAHKRGLSVALKNDLDQIEELEPFYDFAVNEQCFEYNECHRLLPFIKNNKAVLNAEYSKKYVLNQNGVREKICKTSKEYKFSTLILPLSLDNSFRIECK